MQQNNELAATLRVGRVVEFSGEKHAARVKFSDISDKISDWLPLLTLNSHADKYEGLLDVDEHVVCLMSGQGDEFGVILGAIFDTKNEPPFQSGQAHTLTFADGTMIQYDRAASKLSLHCAKEIEVEVDSDIIIKAGQNITLDARREITLKAGSHIQLKAPRIDLN